MWDHQRCDCLDGLNHPAHPVTLAVGGGGWMGTMRVHVTRAPLSDYAIFKIISASDLTISEWDQLGWLRVLFQSRL